MKNGKIDFGAYIQQLRKQNQLPQKMVAEKLDVDISLLCKIEHGERQVQSHMLKPLAKMFKLDYKSLQIQYLQQRIEQDYGEEPFFTETIQKFSNDYNGK